MTASANDQLWRKYRLSGESRFLHQQNLWNDKGLQEIELDYCRRDVFHWWSWWPWTYDPRNAETGISPYLPFELFQRQIELVQFFDARLKAQEDGLVEKSRDIGFTWSAGGFAWYKWRFVPGFKTTFGSRKVEFVDRIGDPDSIFEKIRILMRNLPVWMYPRGFRFDLHDNHMLLQNPENGNTIRGEGGDEMGRGGRNTWYVIDEAAFIARAERVEAATSANSESRIWASTVNPRADVFFTRKRFDGSLRPEQIFRFHYSSDPRRNDEWVQSKKKGMLPHIWAAEFEIDYTASVEDICVPAVWVESAKRITALARFMVSVEDNKFVVRNSAKEWASFDSQEMARAECDRLNKKYNIEPNVEGIGGGDVGAGKAKSVFVARFGPVVTLPVAWGTPDTINTAYKMLELCKSTKLTRSDGYDCTVKYFRFDSPGVGQGVQSVLKHSQDVAGLTITGINTGDKPTERRWPDGKTSQEMYGNLKAEAWWVTRESFKNSHEMVLFLRGGLKEDGAIEHLPSDCIAIPDDTQGPDAQQLAQQMSMLRWTRNERGKIVMETKAQLAARGIASPDYADALVLTNTGESMIEKWARFGRAF